MTDTKTTTTKRKTTTTKKPTDKLSAKELLEMCILTNPDIFRSKDKDKIVLLANKIEECYQFILDKDS